VEAHDNDARSLTSLGIALVLQVEPPSVEKSVTSPTATPTATQSLVDAQDTDLRGPDPLGKVPALQVEPPSVEKSALPT
jgi:hypothetical protein